MNDIEFMTHAEKLAEWSYRRDEFLGIILDSTREAKKLEIMHAEIYADSVVKF